jgi:hypothetical protein
MFNYSKHYRATQCTPTHPWWLSNGTKSTREEILAWQTKQTIHTNQTNYLLKISIWKTEKKKRILVGVGGSFFTWELSSPIKSNSYFKLWELTKVFPFQFFSNFKYSTKVSSFSFKLIFKIVLHPIQHMYLYFFLHFHLFQMNLHILWKNSKSIQMYLLIPLSWKESYKGASIQSLVTSIS